MSETIDDLLEMLNDDLVSHGHIAQYLKQTDPSGPLSEERVRDVLKELLTLGKVEIGVAKLTRPDYVEHVAWRGTVEERVSRATKAVTVANGHDKEFAYWLCLRKNIDRFEKGDD